MLNILIFVPASLPVVTPVSPSINLVQAVECPPQSGNGSSSPSILAMDIQPGMISTVMSNIDKPKQNYLLRQVDRTQALNEDIEFSDDELELIAGVPQVGKSYCSDVVVDDRTIVLLEDVLPYANANDHNGIIQLIRDRFGAAGIPISDAAVGRLSDHLRAEAPRVTKREHRGLLINLSTGQECYVGTSDCTPEFLGQG